MARRERGKQSRTASERLRQRKRVQPNDFVQNFADFGAAANSRQAFPGGAGRLGLAVGSPRGGVPSLVAGEGRREAGGRGAEGLSEK